ncbi:alpha/beta hydrolase [soil metagenome]
MLNLMRNISRDRFTARLVAEVVLITYPRRSIILTALFTIIALAGCSKFDLLNATIPSGGYDRIVDIPYGGHTRQKLDIYRLRDLKPSGDIKPSQDIVVFFYGGDWQDGSKEGYRFVAQALASRGLIAVLLDYRLYPEVTFPAFVEDGALAVRWVHDNAAMLGGDPRHVYLMGHSAGAHIAALLTLDERYLNRVGLDRTDIRATIALSGPYDFAPSEEDRAVFRMQPGQARPDDSAEPITFVDGRAPPMLLIHGQADETVEPGNATRLADRIRAAGGIVDTIYYPGKGHVPVVLAFAWPFRWLAPTLDDVCAYVRARS